MEQNGTGKIETGIAVGVFVKLGNLHGSPFPRLMRGSIQKILELRQCDGIQEALIERLHRRRRVRCWISTSLINEVLSDEQAFPASACLVFSPHRAGSGAEAFRRQHCLPCQQKDRCRYFQVNHAGMSA